MAPTPLLGPPELYTVRTTPDSGAAAPSTDTDPFLNLDVDAMVSEFKKAAVVTKESPYSWRRYYYYSSRVYDPPESPRGLTENGSATYLSSGNPCLDFFFHVVPDTPRDSLTARLSLAWSHDPVVTLKLICNLQGVRGTGKSDKEGFYTAALWLFKNHPKTLGCNIGPMADFGYFKDLPEIIYRLLEGSDMRKVQKKEWQRRKRRPWFVSKRERERESKNAKKLARIRRIKKKLRPSIPREVRVASGLARSKIQEENARSARLEKKIAKAKKLIDRYNDDRDFRFLYDCVSEHFAECLRNDIAFLNSGEVNRIGLAAKWCPSVDSSFDKSTLLCESIARLVFPRESCPEYEGVEEAHYAYRVRDRLRKEVLVPLRKVQKLPEVYIGANDWGSIPYNRVASVAMKFYQNKFWMHDRKRFQEYLKDVRSGRAKIAAGALLPHEIISSVFSENGREVAELQWKRLVDDLLKSGKLDNCIAVCDVSGSMRGTPEKVCVALGILVSELSKAPWKGKVITFSAEPRLHLIKGDSLREKADFMERMDWGCNTDFQKVFDRILRAAKKSRLRGNQMVKRIFVFSDMEFDQASSNPLETDYQVIRRKYEKAGYGNAIPQIVFWNLRDSNSTPVRMDQDGVALVSGFSKNFLKMFLDNDGKIDPERVMLEAISGEEYQKLVVVD